MKRFSIRATEAVAKSRQPGYLDAVRAAATVDDTHYTLTDEAFNELATKYKRALPVQEIPEGWTSAAARAGLDSKGSEGCGC